MLDCQPCNGSNVSEFESAVEADLREHGTRGYVSDEFRLLTSRRTAWMTDI